MATVTIDPAVPYQPTPAEIARLAEAPVPFDTGAEPIFTIRGEIRARIIAGAYQPGDLAAFRRAFRDMTQARFATALGISINTLQNWEQNRTVPDGPAKALLRLLARHPRLLLHDLA